MEGRVSDDTLSIGGGAHAADEEASVFSEDVESVAGDVAPSEIEVDPIPFGRCEPQSHSSRGKWQFG